MTPDIFLSYNREDAGVAKLYADAFAAAGLMVWWDATLRSGEAYDEVTEAALNGAKAVVVLWSPRSVASRWVRAEATVADQNRTLAPVTIEACRRPVMFELTQTADLAHWRGAADDKAWLAFLGDVRRMVERGGPEPAAPASDQATATTKAESGISIVAVLPITFRAGDEDMEILAEDLTEEVTRDLAQNCFFRVMAASTMGAWRAKSIDIRTVGREVGANYLVDGKLQRIGEAVRLTVQLIDAASGSMLQSARLTRRSSDIEAAPEEFPGTIAAQLSQLILHIEMSRAMNKRGPLSGWDHILRARAYTAREGDPDSSRKWVGEARQAVSALPELSLAHAMLACALVAEVTSGRKVLDEATSHEVQAHIKRVSQLGGGDDPVIIGNLQVAYDGLGDGDACLRLARRAVELSPNSPRSQYLLARALVLVGRPAEAVAALRAHDRLSPADTAEVSAWILLGQCHLLGGRLVEAEAAFDRSLAIQPDVYSAVRGKAIVAALRGEEELALAAVRRLREVEPAMSFDDHVRPMMRHRKLAELSGGHVATLRRLWDATGGDE